MFPQSAIRIKRAPVQDGRRGPASPSGSTRSSRVGVADAGRSDQPLPGRRPWSAFAPGAQLAGYGPPSATPVVSGTPLAPVAPPPNATGSRRSPTSRQRRRRLRRQASGPRLSPMTSAYEDPNAPSPRSLRPCRAWRPVAPPWR